MQPEHAEMAANVNGGQYGAPRPSSMPAPNTDAGMPPPRGFSASSLVDAASLPSWVQENQPAAQGPGSGSYFSGEAQAPFSAASLMEPGSLPSWITVQPSQQPHSESKRPSCQAAPGSGGSGAGLSAASLLDMNALPSWLREGQQGYTAQPGQPGQGGSNSNLSAGSLIDMNSLPAWLRNADSQP